MNRWDGESNGISHGAATESQVKSIFSLAGFQVVMMPGATGHRALLAIGRTRGNVRACGCEPRLPRSERELNL